LTANFLSTVGIAQTAAVPLSIYPNPTPGILHIESSATQESFERIELYNSNGKQVMQVNPTTNSKQNTLDMNALPTGLYTLRMYLSNHSLMTSKVVLNK
jgi:hypothetical protein